MWKKQAGPRSAEFGEVLSLEPSPEATVEVVEALSPNPKWGELGLAIGLGLAIT